MGIVEKTVEKTVVDEIVPKTVEVDRCVPKTDMLATCTTARAGTRERAHPQPPTRPSPPPSPTHACGACSNAH